MEIPAFLAGKVICNLLFKGFKTVSSADFLTVKSSWEPVFYYLVSTKKQLVVHI